MDKATLKIQVRYFENYAVNEAGEFDEENPYWKNKGILDYTAKVNDDAIMYASPDEVERAINKSLEAENSSVYRYELVDYKVTFHPTDELKGVEENLINELKARLPEGAEFDS